MDVTYFGIQIESVITDGRKSMLKAIKKLKCNVVWYILIKEAAVTNNLRNCRPHNGSIIKVI